MPAYVLIPKNAKLPAPGMVVLHDHGGFYVWGKEKVVAFDDEHDVLRTLSSSIRRQEHCDRARPPGLRRHHD